MMNRHAATVYVYRVAGRAVIVGGLLVGVGDRCMSAEETPAAPEEIQERGVIGMPKVLQPTQPTSPAGNPTPQMPKAAVQPGLKVSEEAHRVTFTRGTPQWISWDYLRMNHPAAVAGLLSSVKSGALPANSIAGLAHPNDVQVLLNNVAVRPAASGSAAASPKSPLATVAAPSLYASLPIRTTPENIDFGPLLVGQSVSSRVHVTAPATGNIWMDIPDGAFRIRQLISQTGSYRMQDVTIPLPNGGTRHTTVSVPIIEQQVMAPPWAIAVKAGQDLEIIVDVTTQRTIKLGEHSSAIQIHHSDGRSISVPIHARLDGLMYGIGIQVDGSFYVLPGNDLLIPFEWYNEGEPSSAMLTLDNLPTGFTVVTPPAGVTLGKGERRKSSVVINAGTYIAPGSSLTIPFRVTNGPTHLTYAVGIIVVRTWVHQAVGAQAFFDDGERVDVTGFVELRRDGWLLFAGEITSTGTGKGFGISFDSIYRYDVGIVFPNGVNIYAHGSFGHGTIGRSSTTKDTWSESGNSFTLANDFINSVHALSFIDPTIRVTRSSF